ncbi:hypothetical protein BKH41_02195 [Helicobacter sp. 12S02232-10]|uniref:hypothetical protein n=1 Tax=Helicobacter sp. 12S02232-10 TaxID=1476197 RepID=UPI000BA5C787|nr:hypothetical protein [Helicobacter sp. 12S02232-10]PAF49498.1 hypothetical protein BKH41_02195 [Helicobacter sp. 12S02232-10]
MQYKIKLNQYLLHFLICFCLIFSQSIFASEVIELPLIADTSLPQYAPSLDKTDSGVAVINITNPNELFGLSIPSGL